MARHVLALPPATGELPAVGGVIISSPAAPCAGTIEHAGFVYHELWRKAKGVAPADQTIGQKRIADAKSSHPPQDEEDAESLASARLRKVLAKDSEDLYGLLELGDKRWRATADDIKKAFRRISLVYHPDKVSHLGKDALEQSETHFKKIKKAYDVLSDKKKRASYDSIDEVDDSVPSEASITESNFYSKLGPVFDINARWSISDRVPTLGDEATDIEDVHKFYDFWYSFKTWRDFSFDLEYDTDQAECREEKRWMERQNAKHVKVRKLEEAARIRRLVDTAYKNDPRIRRAKEQAREQKEAAKLERRREREAAELAELERQRLQQEDDERRQAAEKEERARAKKDKDAIKKVTRRARQRLRSAVCTLGVLDREDILVALERCCSDLAAHNIDAAASELEILVNGEHEKVFEILNRAMSMSTQEPVPALSQDDVRNAQDDANQGAIGAETSASTERPDSNSKVSIPSNVISAEATSKNCVEQPWTHDETKRLTKALSKFPAGTRDRYEKLAAFVGTRSADSVLAMVNTMRAQKLSSAGSSRANGTVSAGPKAALALDGDDFERFQRDRKKGVQVPPPTYETREDYGVGEQHQKQAECLENDGDPANSILAVTKSVSNCESSSAPLSDKPPNSMAFTPKQQLELEAAMKKYPVSLGNGRWDQIARQVSGRSTSECESRYKELVEYYRAKKNIAAEKKI